MSAELSTVATVLALAASVDTAHRHAALRAASLLYSIDRDLRHWDDLDPATLDDVIRRIRSEAEAVAADIYRLTEGADR